MRRCVVSNPLTEVALAPSNTHRRQSRHEPHRQSTRSPAAGFGFRQEGGSRTGAAVLLAWAVADSLEGARTHMRCRHGSHVAEGVSVAVERESLATGQRRTRASHQRRRWRDTPLVLLRLEPAARRRRCTDDIDEHSSRRISRPFQAAKMIDAAECNVIVQLR